MPSNQNILAWFSACLSTAPRPGDDRPEGDVDMLLIIGNDARNRRRELRPLGYLLAATSEVVPSILAYAEDAWESRRKSGSSFRAAVEREAVPIL